MKYVLVISLFILGAQSLRAQDDLEFDYSKDDISDKWFAGSSLVYDCEDKHWVCVAPSDYANCSRQRESELKQQKHILGCVPADIFSSKKDCQQAAKRLVGQGIYPRVCIHPVERPRFIGFR